MVDLGERPGDALLVLSKKRRNDRREKKSARQVNQNGSPPPPPPHSLAQGLVPPMKNSHGDVNRVEDNIS